jgi:hypothetical protein
MESITGLDASKLVGAITGDSFRALTDKFTELEARIQRLENSSDSA